MLTTQFRTDAEANTGIAPAVTPSTTPASLATCKPYNTPCALARPDGLCRMEINGNGSTDHQHRLPVFTTARPARVQGRVQAATVQRFAFDAVIALRDELGKSGALKVTRDDAVALAQLVKAWDCAADRLRVLRGKGLPASVRAARPRSVQPDEPLVKP